MIPVTIKCELCGIDARTPTDCGLYIPECPRFGIGREEYERLQGQTKGDIEKDNEIMIINFEQKTHTSWHSNCEGGNKHSPPMMEISEHDGGTLLECTLCGERGVYPHGKSGPIECYLEVGMTECEIREALLQLNNSRCAVIGMLSGMSGKEFRAFLEEKRELTITDCSILTPLVRAFGGKR